MKRTQSITLSIAVFYLLLEGGIFLCLLFAKSRGIIPTRTDLAHLETRQKETLSHLLEGKQSFLTFDDELGWTTRAQGRSQNGFDRINAQGIRSDHHIPKTLSKTKRRILTYGDSFTYGAFIDFHETWQQQLEKWDLRYETVNLGVPGYSLDQALLRFRKKHREFNTDFVFIGYMSENINRLLNRFRPFYEPQTELVFSKPRFSVKQGTLELIPNPLKSQGAYENLMKNPKAILTQLAEQDYWADIRPQRTTWDLFPSVRLFKAVSSQFSKKYGEDRIYNSNKVYRESSEGFQILTELFDQFYKEAKVVGTPVILLYPHPSDIEAARKGAPLSYQPLINYLESKKYCFIDGMKAFRNWGLQEKNEDLFVKGHYSARANQLLLGEIHSWLTQADLTC